MNNTTDQRSSAAIIVTTLLLTIVVMVCLMYAALNSFVGDFIWSMTPGWHTVIYPRWVVVSVTTALALLFLATGLLLFSGVKRLMTWCIGR